MACRLGAGLLRDAPRQRRELHRLAEADRLRGRRPAATARSSSGTSSGTSQESSTSLREMRACSANWIRFSRRFGCLISPARASSVSRSPYSSRSCAAVFGPMPGTPGTLSVESPTKRLQIDHLLRIDAELLLHRLAVDDDVLHRVDHDDAGPHELHQVLVGGDDGDRRAGSVRLAGIGRDDVVGLPALLLDAGEVEGARRLPDQPELRDQVGRRLGPVRLVVGVDLVAECLRRIVEDDGEMRRLVARRRRRPLLQDLPDHVAEAEHRADRQAVGFPRQRRQRVEGAEDEAGAVDQDQMVAGIERRLGDLGGCGHGRTFARPPDEFKRCRCRSEPHSWRAIPPRRGLPAAGGAARRASPRQAARTGSARTRSTGSSRRGRSGRRCRQSVTRSETVPMSGTMPVFRRIARLTAIGRKKAR